MPLSRKAKEAIKTALAMTIAYGIALQMNWDEPMWAGFAVAFISLATVGQSLNKAALRMFGTLVAVVVALIIISLFAQDRWLFMVFLSAWVGFCTYMMGGPRHQYFWHVCGFVSVIICVDGGLDPVNAFDTAMLRTQETGLGILVYSLVAIFLWPSSSRAEFDAVTGKLAAVQRELYRAYFDLMRGKGEADAAQALRAQAMQLQAQFGPLLDATTSDSQEIGELSRQWGAYRNQVMELGETMERWRGDFSEVQALDLERLLPGLESVQIELDGRLAQVVAMLGGNSPEQSPRSVDLSFDRDAIAGLSHFHKAAFSVILGHLQQLDRLTLSLFETIAAIRGIGQQRMLAEEGSTARTAYFLPDPDRLLATFRIIVTMWIAWVAVIYVSDIPGGAGLVSMLVPITMALANAPQLSVLALLLPAAASVLMASLLYFFLLPQLSTFAELAVVIFLVTFVICYLFAAPRQTLGRAFGLAMFVSIASITNTQHYSFFVVANTALMFPLVFLFIAVSAYIPISPRPEHAVQRLLGRFFRSCEYLTSTTRVNHWGNAFHAREISTLPAKIATWGKHIDTGAESGATAQQVQAMVTSLQALSYRMQALLEVRGNSQAKYLAQQLQNDIGSWRHKLQQTFQHLGQDPASGQREVFLGSMQKILHDLEVRVARAMDAAADGQVGGREGENFYRLLGVYRGLSEALVDYSGSAGAINWARWREEKFA